MSEMGDGGNAILNVTLPVLLVHPLLVAQLFTMGGQVYALLVSGVTPSCPHVAKPFEGSPAHRRCFASRPQAHSYTLLPTDPDRA